MKKSGQEVSSTPKALSGTTTSLVSNEKIAAGATIKYSVIVYIDDSSVEETDNDKEIALKINGSAEVSADNINPQLPNK